MGRIAFHDGAVKAHLHHGAVGQLPLHGQLRRAQGVHIPRAAVQPGQHQSVRPRAVHHPAASHGHRFLLGKALGGGVSVSPAGAAEHPASRSASARTNRLFLMENPSFTLLDEEDAKKFRKCTGSS